MHTTSLILGAGFSYSSGLPLTNQLFDELPRPSADNKNLLAMYANVKKEWEKWKALNRNSPELWLKELYLNSYSNQQISYADASDFVMARVTNIPIKYGKNGAYYYGISTSIKNEQHQAFWKIIRMKFNVKSVITTNYDIVIEQGLRERYSTDSNDRQAPDCRYGGFPHSFEQKIKITTNVTKKLYREDILKGDIEVFKLHGSINWVKEPHAFKIHDDVRAVYRINRKLGKPDIIPPMEEKLKPSWAHMVWEYAEKRLVESSIWFVCGYSMADYDLAIKDMMRKASQNKKNLLLYLSDPFANDLEKKWREIIACPVKIVLLKGMPELNDELKTIHTSYSI
jgi:hypothetical protein